MAEKLNVGSVFNDFIVTTGIGDKYDRRNITHVNMLHEYVVARCINEHMTLIEFSEFFDRMQSYIALIKKVDF